MANSPLICVLRTLKELYKHTRVPYVLKTEPWGLYKSPFVYEHVLECVKSVIANSPLECVYQPAKRAL